MRHLIYGFEKRCGGDTSCDGIFVGMVIVGEKCGSCHCSFWNGFYFFVFFEGVGGG